MVKKIIFAAIAIAIIAAGLTGVKKLGYWQKSVRIFSFNPAQVNDGRIERNHSNPEVRTNAEGSGNLRESNRSDDDRPNDFRREESHQRTEGGESGRGGSHNENGINLSNVWWFLSVFAAFTVIAVYSDKAIKYILQKHI